MTTIPLPTERRTDQDFPVAKTAWQVPFVDFPEQYRRQEHQLLATVRDVLSKGDLIMRHQLTDFEDHLAEFVGVRFAVGVSNCTDAIRLMAHALDVGPGDEVVTVAHTFVATISPWKLRGATPVLVDIGDDHLMDPMALDSAIGDATRVILPVHLNGRICDMDPILASARRVGAVVVEDAAQALGATYKGQAGGTFGTASVYSFYPAKILGALGDGGALVTDDPDLAERIRMLRDHGRVTKTELGGWGYNCRLDNLQAAILDLRLTMLPEWIARRRALAARYHSVLGGNPQIGTLPGPGTDDAHGDVWQNYPVLVPDRDGLVAHLNTEGIETLVSWPIPLHHQKALGLDHFQLPRTEELSRDVVSLPLFPELEDWQVDFVADTVARFCR